MHVISKTPVRDAVKMAQEAFGTIDHTQSRHTNLSVGFHLAEDIVSTLDLPPFTKSTVDGYAVRAENTKSASKQSPVVLKVVGESFMGKSTGTLLEDGQAQYVPTGGMVPEGANAMVMIEDTDLGTDTVQIFSPARSGANMIFKGQDIVSGQVMLHKGVKLGPRHIGLMVSMGKEYIQVYKKPKVAIITTGDELIELGNTPVDGQIYDINTHSVRALCEEYGLEVILTLIVKDNFELLCKALNEAGAVADVILLSGGSSVGKKDMTVDAVKTLNGVQILVHGLAFKPGKPTLIAKAQNQLILGLPGHPVSALMVMDTVGRRLLDSVWHMQLPQRHRIEGILAERVIPDTGRDTCQMVRIEKENGTISVIPVNGKSGMISWIGCSDGYIVAEHVNGTLDAGRRVTVYLWDNHSDFIGMDWI